MSEIVTCNFDPVALKPIATSWIEESNGDEFGLDIDVDKGVEQFRKMVMNDNADVLLLVIQGKIVGFTGLLIFTSPLSDQRICNEHYMYILPKYRKGKNPIKIIHAAEDWAREHGCTHIMFNASNLASGLHDKVCRMYERLKMHKFETSYIAQISAKKEVA